MFYVSCSCPWVGSAPVKSHEETFFSFTLFCSGNPPIPHSSNTLITRLLRPQKRAAYALKAREPLWTLVLQRGLEGENKKCSGGT